MREWVQAEPKHLKQVLDQVQAGGGIKVSKNTLKRVVKAVGMTWRRMKRGLAGEPEEWEFAIKLERLHRFKDQERKGAIALRSLAEAGRSLVPCIPYGWQAKDETMRLKRQSSKRLTILGLFSPKNELVYEGMALT